MRTVLFVDDEDSMLHAIKQLFLDDTFMRLLVASNGEEALEIVRKEDVWLVVSDNHMPGIYKFVLFLCYNVLYECNYSALLV